MRDYFIRRFLLIPPTLLGVTFLVFLITRLVPGGPMERAMQESQKASEESGGSSSSGQSGSNMDEDDIEKQEEEFGYDKIIPVAYLQWLGVIPRERRISKAEFRALDTDKIGGEIVADPEKETTVVLAGTGREAKITRNGTKISLATYVDTGKPIADDGWKMRIETVQDRKGRWARRNKEDISKAPEKKYSDRVVAYKTRFAGILQGDFNRSSEFGDPVLSLIFSRMPVALYFGILTALISYSVCIPLGIVKAIKHRTPIDNITSILIFVGYAIPGFALGAILVVYLGARAQLFPIFGLTSPTFGEMDFGAKVWDLAKHTVLPLTCYVISSFAFLTMMVKNNLMDNLATDYVRTAVSKGASFRSAIFKHAFRNSFIPVASTLGQLITLLVGGSILIESVFDIQGFGLLQFQALLGRDIYVIMGTLSIGAMLLLIGNILSDFIVALIDPRVKFN